MPRIVNIERTIEASRKVLLILTPDWIASEWTNFESLLIQTDDLSSRIHRTLPLLLKPCDNAKAPFDLDTCRLHTAGKT